MDMIKRICGCMKNWQSAINEGYMPVSRYGSDGTIEYKNKDDDRIFLSPVSYSSNEWKAGFSLYLSRYVKSDCNNS